MSDNQHGVLPTPSPASQNHQSPVPSKAAQTLPAEAEASPTLEASASANDTPKQNPLETGRKAGQWAAETETPKPQVSETIKDTLKPSPLETRRKTGQWAAETGTPPSQVSETAKDTHEQDPLGMGRTAGQRTAEVFAGLRAELMRTPETDALTRISGRITARMIKSVGSPKVLNFVPVRDGSFTGLIKQALGNDGTGKILVEVAAGFSARGLHLAKEMPNLQVIEVDLPDVVTEKHKRLERGHIAIPSNITWKSADLGVQPLSEVLGQQHVDVVTAEGLLPYFEFPDITRIARHMYASLNPGGVFIADLGFTDSQGAKEANGLVQIFRRYTRSSPGAVTDEETAYRLFREAGYETVELYRMPQTAALFDLPQPVSDVLFFMVAHKKA
ncbi:MAG: class I SAM-dependent methyltransferase [Chloroflexota bacterium]